MSLTERELLYQLANGSPVAFRSIFDQYYETVVSRANSLIQDVNLSRDIGQEVFLSLWKNRRSLPEKMVLEAYLRRAAITRAINLVKSRKHHISAGEEPLSFVKTSTPDPQQIIDSDEKVAAINNCIDQLPQRCKEVFILNRIEKISHKMIATQLGISTKTIENQMTKALKFLRKCIYGNNE